MCICIHIYIYIYIYTHHLAEAQGVPLGLHPPGGDGLEPRLALSIQN